MAKAGGRRGPMRGAAWRLVGLFVSVPGVLELADGRLAFTTEDGRLFDAPVSEVSDLVYPWYYFGGGLKLRVSGARYRFSFVRPNDASDIPGRLLARAGDVGAGLLTVGRKVSDIGDGIGACRRWRDALEEAVPTAQPPVPPGGPPR